MPNQWKYALAVLMVSALSGCSHGFPADTPLQQTHYAATQHIFLSDILPPPPRSHSTAQQNDLSAVLKAQHTRTKMQIVQARLDNELSVFRFEPALGNWFTPQTLPVTAAFFQNVKQDEDRIVQLAKIHYARPRPFLVSPDVKPILLSPSGNPSYPSGHATFAYVTAILLSRMMPEKAPQIFERADEFARNRVIAGVHYPTDIEAGKISGSIIAHDLMLDKKFMADFDRSEQELRNAGMASSLAARAESSR